MSESREIEIKLRVRDDAEAVRKIEAAGFEIVKPRVHETNTLFDTPEESLRARKELLRVRQVGERTVLTYKGPHQPGRHRSREERELELSDAKTFGVILGKLGYQPLFRYEKFRTEYARSGEPGVVTFDETPIGVYLELEGPGDWIDRVAEELGFAEDDYVLSSYGTLFLEWKKRTGSEARHMLFEESGDA